MTAPSRFILNMIPLRQFQQQLEYEAYQAWLEVLYVLAVSATGSGKTVFFSKIIADNPGPSCAIAHRQELVSQISIALARNGIRHGLIAPQAVRKNISALHVADDSIKYNFVDPNARAKVAGVDTLVRIDPNSVDGRWLSGITLWVQDEAHHVLRANKWGKAIELFPNARGLGVTATPERADGRGLGRHADGVFDKMILAPSMRDLIDMGYLTDYRIICQPVDDVNLNGIDTDKTGDFNQVQLRAAMHKSDHIVGDVVGHYIKWAAGKLGVTFAVDVEHATEIAAAFRAASVPAEVVTSETPTLLRADILRKFKQRKILQLVNVDLFGEGFDLPAIEVISFARPTQSFPLYVQQFGRDLRLMISDELTQRWESFTNEERRAHIKAGSKPYGMIIDHVNNVLRHGLPDRARVWSLDSREKRGRSTNSDVIPLRNCLNVQCMQPYERIYVCCPHCAAPYIPPDRSAPEQVDGDLIELDPSVLAAMRGEIERIDGPANINPRGDPAVTGAIKRNHWERQQAQYALRTAMAWWSGLQNAHGRIDVQEQYRRFYFQYGIDLGTAETLGTRDASALRDKIAAHLAQFNIDATVPGGVPAFN